MTDKKRIVVHNAFDVITDTSFKQLRTPTEIEFHMGVLETMISNISDNKLRIDIRQLLQKALHSGNIFNLIRQRAEVLLVSLYT